MSKQQHYFFLFFLLLSFTKVLLGWYKYCTFDKSDYFLKLKKSCAFHFLFALIRFNGWRHWASLCTLHLPWSVTVSSQQNDNTAVFLLELLFILSVKGSHSMTNRHIHIKHCASLSETQGFYQDAPWLLLLTRNGKQI